MPRLVATAKTTVDASKWAVWRALTDPAQVKKWFFGTDQRTDWKPGSPITWSGDWEGKAYEDKGTVVAVNAPNRLEVTHWSPLSGAPDTPENYHTLVYTLHNSDGGTEVSLSQDNNADQKEADQNSETWSQMLTALKKHVEAG